MCANRISTSVHADMAECRVMPNQESEERLKNAWRLTLETLESGRLGGGGFNGNVYGLVVVSINSIGSHPYHPWISQPPPRLKLNCFSHPNDPIKIFIFIARSCVSIITGLGGQGGKLRGSRGNGGKTGRSERFRAAGKVRRSPPVHMRVLEFARP